VLACREDLRIVRKSGWNRMAELGLAALDADDFVADVIGTHSLRFFREKHLELHERILRAVQAFKSLRSNEVNQRQTLMRNAVHIMRRGDGGFEMLVQKLRLRQEYHGAGIVWLCSQSTLQQCFRARGVSILEAELGKINQRQPEVIVQGDGFLQRLALLRRIIQAAIGDAHIVVGWGVLWIKGDGTFQPLYGFRPVLAVHRLSGTFELLPCLRGDLQVHGGHRGGAPAARFALDEVPWTVMKRSWLILRLTTSN